MDYGNICISRKKGEPRAKKHQTNIVVKEVKFLIMWTTTIPHQKNHVAAFLAEGIRSTNDLSSAAGK